MDNTISPLGSTDVKPFLTVEKIDLLSNIELNDLCDALESTINDNHGFSTSFLGTKHPIRNQLENYFKGVMLVPERHLIIGRLDGVIAGSIQLVKSSPSNHSMSFAAAVQDHFIAPWARGVGLAKELLRTAEYETRKFGFITIRLSVNSTMVEAIKLYETCGYQKWGVLPKYEKLGNDIVAGNFYYKDL